MDLTVAAVPAYFATMAAEARALARRAERDGPSASDYTKPDTVASLSMGVGSLLVPLATHALARRIAPSRTKAGKVALAAVAAAAAATTVADAVARRSKGRRRERARQVAAVGGVGAVAGGAVLAGATYIVATKPTEMWRNRPGSRDIGTGVAAWAVAIAGWDAIYYWNHRIMHEVRGLWAIHVVHHSSQRYNLSTALRQPVADALGVFVPYGLLTRLGVRPFLIEQARAINLLYQYWIHTDLVDRLGQAEEVLNTPSHHRVHHGANPRYIDRNHGSILIVWDRLFGTFERESEPVVYGLTRNIDTYNPARIATHEYRDIVSDIAASECWRDRLSFVLRGPGWAYARRAEMIDASADGAVGNAVEVAA